MEIAWQVKVANIDVSDHLTRFEITETYGSFSTILNIRFKKTIDSDLTIANGQIIEVWYNRNGTTIDDSVKLFKGIIEDVKDMRSYYEVYCVDMLGLAGKKEINRIFLDTDPEGGIISEIVKTLLTEAGLSFSSTSIQNSSAFQDGALKRFVCRNANIFERLKKLAQAVNFQLYYNPKDDLVYFQQKGILDTEKTLTVGDEIRRIINWQESTEDMINSITIVGSRQLVETTETFSGDGTTTTFTLQNPPESIKVYVNGVLRKGGLEGTTTNPDYIVDKPNKKIIFTTAPPSGTNNIVVNYSYTVPIPITVKDDTSIATYGVYAKTITLTDVFSLNDAIQRAKNIIEARKKPKFFATDVAVRIDVDVNVGETVRVVDNIKGIDQKFIVVKRKIAFPSAILYIDLGDLAWENARMQEETMDRVKRLEELLFENEDIITNVVQLGERNLVIKPQSLTIYGDTRADSFILGSEGDNPKLGIGKILDNFDGTASDWESTTLTIVNDSSTVLVGTQSLRLTWSSSGTHKITTTKSFGDLSSFVGVSSGLPTQGTIGLWVNISNPNAITEIKIRIGSSSSDYVEKSGSIYASSELGYSYSDFTGWLYHTFNLNTATVIGDPNWAAISFVEIEFTTTSTSDSIYLDYLTISSSNEIGLNGLGERSMPSVVLYTINYP